MCDLEGVGVSSILNIYRNPQCAVLTRMLPTLDLNYEEKQTSVGSPGECLSDEIFVSPGEISTDAIIVTIQIIVLGLEIITYQ